MTTNASARPEQEQTSVCDIQTLKSALQSAADDIENLGNVLSWLAQVFFDIGQKCKDKDSVMPMYAIETMADMGNFLAVSWGETATLMVGSATEVVDGPAAAEAYHD